MEEKRTFNESMIGFMDAVKQVAGEAALMTLAKEAGRVTDEILEALQVRVKDFALPALSAYINQDKFTLLQGSIREKPRILFSARENIDKMRQGIRELRRDLANREQSAKEAEVAIIAEIASDPAFTNEKMRTAELMKRKKTDEEYRVLLGVCQDGKHNVEGAEDELSSMEASYKQLENEFTSELAVLNAKNAEIGFYAAALSATQIKIGG